MRVRLGAVLVAVLIVLVGAFAGLRWSGTLLAADRSEVFEGPVPRAACGPGSSTETALQGQVPKADRDSGRSAMGYRCNLERIGGYQGEGASWVSQSYGNCAYMATKFPSLSSSRGVQVLDVSDRAHPRKAATLASPAMLGTWETLRVHAGRGLLAGVSASGPLGNGPLFFDVYDIKRDCAHPRLLSSRPLVTWGHEGGFSLDGLTYWSASAYEGTVTAIDLADPAAPRVLLNARTGPSNHGFGLSPDGNRLYLAQSGRFVSGVLQTSVPDARLNPNGLQIFDVSDVQARRPSPQIREISHLYWDDGAAGQHAIHLTYSGRPHLLFVDEMLSGAARMIDIANERRPRIVSKLKLEIQMPENESLRKGDTPNDAVFGYDAHYCETDRTVDPTALACGYFASGVRVFDIRDPHRPNEIAYFNPPAQVGKTAQLRASEHAVAAGDLTTDWCTSPPRFVGQQLWVTCQDNGFMVLRFTNGAYPLPPGTSASLGLPKRCKSRRRFTIHLRRGLRSARVSVNGKTVKVLRGKRLRAVVNLRGLPRGVVRVRVVGRTRSGRAVSEERVYRTCRPRR